MSMIKALGRYAEISDCQIKQPSLELNKDLDFGFQGPN